jgi:hypothetical protein
MFSKLKTLKSFGKETLNVEELRQLVKNNTQKELIEKIRSVEYKSKEYNKLKLLVSAITPHGVFSSLKNDGLSKLSGYLYYDIDGFDTEIELNDTKQRLIETNLISFLCKSVGGKGLSFLVKIKDDTFNEPNDTFNDIYNYVRDMFIDMGFNIDKAAGGLVRKMIISSDDNLYFNKEVSLGIDKVSFQTWKQRLMVVKKIKKRKEEQYAPNDTFLEIIPFEELLKEIKIETPYEKEIHGEFIIDETEYYRILIPKVIKDGTKHKLYIKIINALHYINSDITPQQVYSYLAHINYSANPPMNIYKLQSLVKWLCSTIQKTGEIRIKSRVKRLHFNKDCKLTKKEKQSMGAKLGAKLKNNKTIELIEKARIECYKKNEIPTQKKIVELTGLSIATVKRNWRKEINDLNDIKVDRVDEVQLERDYKLSQLVVEEEDDWFKDWQPKKRLEEKAPEDKDFGESDGIEGLIECLDI